MILLVDDYPLPRPPYLLSLCFMSNTITSSPAAPLLKADGLEAGRSVLFVSSCYTPASLSTTIMLWVKSMRVFALCCANLCFFAMKITRRVWKRAHITKSTISPTSSICSSLVLVRGGLLLLVPNLLSLAATVYERQ